MRKGVHAVDRAAVWATGCLAALLLVLAGCGGGGGGGSIAPPPPAALTITTSSLPDGINGMAYTQTTVQASGGTGTRTWSATGLPAGLDIGPTTGTITGTPTAAGSFSVTVQVQDSSSPPRSASRQLTIRIFDPLAISTTSLPNGAVGAAYNQTVTASGGLGPFTWDVSGGSLPPGLAPGSSTTNSVTVSGTPTAGGPFNFTLRVRDSLSPQQSDTQDFTVQVLQITTASLSDGVQNQAYGPVSVGVTGNVGTLSWSQMGLPAGLALDAATGVISGTPTAFGTFTVNVTVTDTDGPRSTTRGLGLFIAEELVLDTTALPGTTTGITPPYSQTRGATGGVPPYSWSEPTASFDTVTGEGVGKCEGLALDFETGTIAGTPVNVGTCGAFTLRVRDSASPAQTDEAPFSIVIGPGLLTIVTASLPPGAKNRSYSQTLEASGGTPPFRWSEPTASFDMTGEGVGNCQGLTLSFSAGTITGTPVNEGTCGPFDLQVDDDGGQFATRTGLSILINPEPVARNDTVARATALTTNGNQTIEASISPFSDASTSGPDQDFYKLTAGEGTIVMVEIFARRTNPQSGVNLNSKLDSVVEIVADNGTDFGRRLMECRESGNDANSTTGNRSGVDNSLDETPLDFDDACLNDDIVLGDIRDSRIEFKAPTGQGNPFTFFIRVLDWGGNARPDFRYNLTITGAN